MTTSILPQSLAGVARKPVLNSRAGERRGSIDRGVDRFGYFAAVPSCFMPEGPMPLTWSKTGWPLLSTQCGVLAGSV